MKHAEYAVDLVDKSGRIVGQKLREEIDKTIDLYHTVFVLVMRSNGVVLSKIPHREDLPNLYEHSFGTTAATIRRSGERAQQAAHRVLATELSLPDTDPKHLGNKYLDLRGRGTFASLFICPTNQPLDYDPASIDALWTMPMSDFERRLAEIPDQFAPTLVSLWQAFNTQVRAAA